MAQLTKESMIRELSAEEEPAPISWGAEWEDIVAGGLMALLLITLLLQVGSRYILGSPYIWTEEAARYMFIAMVFIGSAGAVTRRGHIAIEMFVNLLAPAHRKIAGLLSDALVLLFLGFMIYWGIKVLPRVWNVPTPAMEMSSGYLYLLVPLAGMLMAFRLAQNLVSWRRQEKEGVI